MHHFKKLLDRLGKSDILVKMRITESTNVNMKLTIFLRIISYFESLMVAFFPIRKRFPWMCLGALGNRTVF